MVTVRPRVLLAVLLAAGAVLLTACGNALQPGSGPGTEPTTAGPTTAEPTGAAATSPGVSTIPPITPSAVPTSAGGGGVHPGPTGIPIGTGRPVTIDGIIEAGVEPGCKILIAGNTRFLVLGGQDAPMGVPVRVEGVLQPGVLSTCQQGTPLRVTSVKRR
jgi:hypothetical protein